MWINWWDNVFFWSSETRTPLPDWEEVTSKYMQMAGSEKGTPFSDALVEYWKEIRKLTFGDDWILKD